MWILPPLILFFSREIIVLSMVYNFLHVFLQNRKLTMPFSVRIWVLIYSYLKPREFISQTQRKYSEKLPDLFHLQALESHPVQTISSFSVTSGMYPPVPPWFSEILPLLQVWRIPTIPGPAILCMFMSPTNPAPLCVTPLQPDIAGPAHSSNLCCSSVAFWPLYLCIEEPWHHLPQPDVLSSPPTGSTHTCCGAPKFFINTTQNLKKSTPHIYCNIYFSRRDTISALFKYKVWFSCHLQNTLILQNSRQHCRK